jgi:hypothetical protein
MRTPRAVGALVALADGTGILPTLQEAGAKE